MTVTNCFFFLPSYTWEAVDTKNNILYKISVCKNVNITQCGPSSAICMYNWKTKTYRSVGESEDREILVWAAGIQLGRET